MNTVGIIIAVYNRTHLLERAIKSIYTQNFDEIIVINGGASELASQKIEEVINKYPKIVYRRFKTDIGFAGAKNEGVKLANSDWVGVLDDDDFYTCNIADVLKKFILDHDEYDIIHHKILDKSWNHKSYWGSEAFTQEQLERGNQIPGSSFFKKSLHAKIGGFKNIPYEDWEFWIRAGRNRAKFIFFPTSFYCREIQPDSAQSMVAKKLTVEEWKKKYILPKSSPTISIIITTLNRSHLIERAIKSVYNQDFDEIILVNDGSSEEETQILKTILKSYSKIIYIENETNEGLGNSRNKAVFAATSEWILPLDDDDYILEETANKLKTFISQNTSAHVIHHTIKDIVEDGRELLWGEKEIILDNLLRQNQLPGTSVFKKEIWNEVGGYSNVVHPDWNFWIRISKHGGKFVYFPEVFYCRERQPASLQTRAIIKNQKTTFSLNVCKTIDVYGWAFHFIAQEMKKYSRHIISWSKCASIPYKKLDVLLLSCGVTLPSTIAKNAKDAGLGVIGQYSSENISQPYDEKTVDLILAISPQIYAYCKCVYTIPVIYLPESVDTQQFRRKLFNPHTFAVGWVGKENPIKRPWILEKLDRRIIKQENHGAQFFVETRTTDSMVHFYHSMDCIIVISATEANSRVILEAMSCGLPVVSTDVGMASILLDKQWIVPVIPESSVISQMNDKLTLLEKNPELRKQVGERNRRFIEKYFSWAVNQKYWDEVFSAVYMKNFDHIRKISDYLISSHQKQFELKMKEGILYDTKNRVFMRKPL